MVSQKSSGYAISSKGSLRGYTLPKKSEFSQEIISMKISGSNNINELEDKLTQDSDFNY